MLCVQGISKYIGNCSFSPLQDYQTGVKDFHNLPRYAVSVLLHSSVDNSVVLEKKHNSGFGSQKVSRGAFRLLH